MSIPTLNEDLIRTQAAPESFNRGMSYYHSGAVGELRLRGGVLRAEVEGSDVEPYLVALTFDKGGIRQATCTCPYDWGGWCKHIVATALKCIYEPRAALVLPPLETLLAGLTRDQLQALLVALADDDPALTDGIERQVTLARLAAAVPSTAKTPAPARRSPIDQQAIQRQVRAAIRPARHSRYDSYDSYDDEEEPGDEAVEQLRPLLEQAQRFSEAGDGHSALAVLEALTESLLTGGQALFDEVEEVYGSLEGPLFELIGDIATAWAEAILSADLSADERDAWGEKIAGWADAAAEISAEIDDSFDIALTAAEQGWTYPPLRAALRGQFGEQGAWAGAAPDFADSLASIRLRVLDRQGRHQEYLHLAQAEGQLGRYVAMLAKLGRTQEALAAGLTSLTTVEEFSEVARLLRERGDLEAALQLAERGVALKPPPDAQASGSYGMQPVAELAGWAAELAAGMGYVERAIGAAREAFRAAPSLSAYLKAQALAGERWPDIAPGLLAQLRRSPAAQAKIEIFLHERLIDDAIAAVAKAYDLGLLRRVMDAANDSRPDWVVTAASAQAEPIMDAGKSQDYAAAADWLRRARDAYRAAGKEADWRAYIAAIRAKHARKYKLLALLIKL